MNLVKYARIASWTIAILWFFACTYMALTLYRKAYATMLYNNGISREPSTWEALRVLWSDGKAVQHGRFNRGEEGRQPRKGDYNDE